MPFAFIGTLDEEQTQRDFHTLLKLLPLKTFTEEEVWLVV
jgi:hypothetical protein